MNDLNKVNKYLRIEELYNDINNLENKIGIINKKNLIKLINNKFSQIIKFFLYRIYKILILKKIELNNLDKIPSRITAKEFFTYLKNLIRSQYFC